MRGVFNVSGKAKHLDCKSGHGTGVCSYNIIVKHFVQH